MKCEQVLLVNGLLFKEVIKNPVFFWFLHEGFAILLNINVVVIVGDGAL